MKSGQVQAVTVAGSISHVTETLEIQVSLAGPDLKPGDRVVILSEAAFDRFRLEVHNHCTDNCGTALEEMVVAL